MKADERKHMQIFISWSGEQTKALGHALKDFIETTFAGHVLPFLSDSNIAPGERFNEVINDNLDGSVLGILLLTRSNVSEPWILFEAGALAGKTRSGSVIPLLVDLERAELRPPLSQFNNVYGSLEEDVRKLCSRVNAELGEKLTAASFNLLFTEAWPKLQSAITRAQSLAARSAIVEAPRTQDDMLSEILLGVNALVRSTASAGAASSLERWKSTPVINNEHLVLVQGDRIAHTDFGEGSVLAVTGEGAKRIAHVKFDVAGNKKLLIKVAPIEVA